MEGRFRIFRKEAAKLQQEIANGDRPAAPRRGGASTITTPGSSFADDEGSTPKKPKTTKPRSTASTPRANKKGDGKVLAGRVVKTTNPVKKEKAVKVEDEEDGMEVDADSVAEGLGLLDGVFGFGNEGELEV